MSRSYYEYVDLAEYDASPIHTLLCWSRPLSWQDQGDGRTVRLQIVQVLAPDEETKPRPPIYTDGYVVCDSYAAALAEANLFSLEQGMIPAFSAVSSHWIHDDYPRAWHRLNNPVPGYEWPEDLELGACLSCSGKSSTIWVCSWEFRSPDSKKRPANGVCRVCAGTRRQPVIYRQYGRESEIRSALRDIRREEGQAG